MIKQNTTHGGLLGFIEKVIRYIPIVYIIFRKLVKYTNYFEDDFYHLCKIFNNKRINIIDVGASDGIATKFFLNNLNSNKIFCYEPQSIFLPYLKRLKKKYPNNIVVFNYGLGKKSEDQSLFVPFVNFFGKKLYLSTYTFPKKNELEKQIILDFLIYPKITKIKIKLKKTSKINVDIDLIKIDTNGSELDVIISLMDIIKKNYPILIIENNDIRNIYKLLKKYDYDKFYVLNGSLKKHTNQRSGNVIFKKKF
jgi:FkbM family methyltransferase